jgi:hypothetical protein
MNENSSTKRFHHGVPGSDARPLAHNAFKVELAQRVALRALQTAGART